MKSTAFASVGMDASKESISLLIDGMDLMLRSGLKTRNTRKTFIVLSENKGKNSTIPIMTTMKSSQFQGSLI